MRQVHCLSGLSDDELRQVATRMRHHLSRPGRIVVREGTPADRFNVIERGVAEVWVDDEHRPRRRLTRGDYFGETSLLECLPHSSTVRAASWLSVFAVAPGDFQRLIAPHFCGQVSDRLSTLRALRRFSIFADLSTRELDGLAARVQRKNYPLGPSSAPEGEPAEALYLEPFGVNLARQHRPHLVLLDIDLPDISGEVVLQRLRETAETREIPVVVLGDDPGPTQIDRMRAAGARAYLPNPLDVRKFLVLLDELIKESKIR